MSKLTPEERNALALVMAAAKAVIALPDQNGAGQEVHEAVHHLNVVLNQIKARPTARDLAEEERLRQSIGGEN